MMTKLNERIEKLAARTVAGEMYVHPVATEYDRTDLFLDPEEMAAKRVCEYIRNQEPLIVPESAFTGLIQFDGSVQGDIFHRSGHPNFGQVSKYFYNRPVDNLMTFEWQHSVGDFGTRVRTGLRGVRAEIAASRAAHADDPAAQRFLDGQEMLCDAMDDYAAKCSERAELLADQVDRADYRANLLRLADALRRIPEEPAANFYEAVLAVYFSYGYCPDSIGLIDRYLLPYYRADIAAGTLTPKDATEYLQELFLMLQARIPISSDRFYRGGESHFCVGGTLPDGTDGFTDFSRLIVDALMALPTWIPQISLRWTEKTPHEVLAYMMDCERHDSAKRIAFVNDTPRLHGLMTYAGLPFAEAVEYSMIGCNELALPGGMVLGFDMVNILRPMERTMARDDVCDAADFDAFYAIYQSELDHDMDEADRIGGGLQTVRSRDIHVVSNSLLSGCIRNAKSILRGGGDRYLAVCPLIGLPNAIDCLAIVKQFVYDEKRVSMRELRDALRANWAGYEELHTAIGKYGHFFGNADPDSTECAHRLMASLRRWNTGENYLHRKWLFGNLIGYNAHNVFFGRAMGATPDGRFAGEQTQFGIGQSGGKDRSGLPALLRSIATCDPDTVLTGPSVTNILLDAQIARDDAQFAKLIALMESYFRMGGTHFQLNYVSAAELRDAQQHPERHRSLRVRVSGFSDYFVNLNADLQSEIVKRTEQA